MDCYPLNILITNERNLFSCFVCIDIDKIKIEIGMQSYGPSIDVDCDFYAHMAFNAQHEKRSGRAIVRFYDNSSFHETCQKYIKRTQDNVVGIVTCHF